MLTQRLALRPLEPRDAMAFLAAVNRSRAELGRFLGWPHALTSFRQSLRYIDVTRDGLETGLILRLGIFERSGGSLVGNIDLYNIDRLRKDACLGYWISSDRAGLGYATEAASAVLAYGFETLGLEKIYAEVAVGNASSARVLEKLGFALEGTVRKDYLARGVFFDHWLYTLSACRASE